MSTNEIEHIIKDLVALVFPISFPKAAITYGAIKQPKLHPTMATDTLIFSDPVGALAIACPKL